jgi:hypothetical protein
MPALAIPTAARPRRKSRLWKRGLFVVLAVIWTFLCLVALTLAFSAVRQHGIGCGDCFNTAP